MDFNYLPTELLRLIISFFDEDTKLIARVNRKWFNLIDERDFVTFMVSDNQVEEVVDTFLRCGPIYLSFMKNKFRKIQDISNSITRLSSLTGLEIELVREKSEVSEWMALTVLTDLQYLKVLQNDDKIPSGLYSHLKGLTLLEGFRPKLTELDVLKKLSKLQSLEIDLKRDYNPFDLVPNPSILTNLIAIGGKFKFDPQDLNPYINTLKELIYDETEPSQLFPVGVLTNLDSLGITAQDIDEYPANLTSLSVVEVSPCHLTTLTKLKFLSITCNESWSELEKKVLFSYIKALDLKELTINGLEVPSETGSNYFSELAKFTRLEYLSLSIAEKKIDSAALSQAIHSLTNLVQIDLQTYKNPNGVMPIITISSTMSRLTNIMAYGCKIVLEDAAQMTSLKEISGAIMRDSKNATLLTNLEKLDQLPYHPITVAALPKFQNLTCLSLLGLTNHASMYFAIGQLTKLESLTLPVKITLNMEIWTNLNKLTYLDIDVQEPTPLANLTLLTSLQLLYASMNSEENFRLDEQSLYEKLPNLYCVSTSYY